MVTTLRSGPSRPANSNAPEPSFSVRIQMSTRRPGWCFESGAGALVWIIAGGGVRGGAEPI